MGITLGGVVIRKIRVKFCQYPGSGHNFMLEKNIPLTINHSCVNTQVSITVP